jgi:hypothetical protein
MFDIHVDFFKAAFVEQNLEPFARGQLALGVLGIDPLLAAAHPGRPPLLHLCHIRAHRLTSHKPLGFAMGHCA